MSVFTKLNCGSFIASVGSCSVFFFHRKQFSFLEVFCNERKKNDFKESVSENEILIV